MNGENVWADGGYSGDPTIIHRLLPGLTCEFKIEMARCRARHETINGRFTDLSSLRDVYSHDLNKHHLIFDAVAIVTHTNTDVSWIHTIPMLLSTRFCFSLKNSLKNN
jgi:hypothetical protein